MKWILLLLIIAVAVVFFLASKKPKRPKYARSILINAEPQDVISHINDLHKFNEWNPWLQADPNAEQRYEGTDKGVGQIYHWNGKRTGQGTIEVTKSTADKVVMGLKFIKPMPGEAVATFDVIKEGNQTRVTWSFTSGNTFFARVFTVFMNMEKMMNKSFDQGLGNLKTIIET